MLFRPPHHCTISWEQRTHRFFKELHNKINEEHQKEYTALTETMPSTTINETDKADEKCPMYATPKGTASTDTVNQDEDDQSKLTIFAGRISDILHFGNVRKDNKDLHEFWDETHFWSSVEFRELYFSIVDQKIKVFKRMSRTECMNMLGGKKLKCRCFSVLKYNTKLLHDVSRFSASMSLCLPISSFPESLGIEDSNISGKVKEFQNRVLDNLVRVSTSSVPPTLSDFMKTTYREKQWKLFQFISQYGMTYGQDFLQLSKARYKNVCSSAVMNVLCITKGQWNSNLHTFRESRKNKPGKCSPQKRSSPRLSGKKRKSYTGMFDDDEISPFDMGSIEVEKKSDVSNVTMKPEKQTLRQSGRLHKRMTRSGREYTLMC